MSDVFDEIKKRGTLLPGQSASSQKIDALQARASQEREELEKDETLKFTEDIMHWIGREGIARGLTMGQTVFAVALATINLRETFPPDHPKNAEPDERGKAFFDRVAYEAQLYYEIMK